MKGVTRAACCLEPSRAGRRLAGAVRRGRWSFCAAGPRTAACLRLAFGLWPGQNRRERMAVTAVIGRDEALGSIRAFIAAVERGPMALVLSGEAGIGKTILWEEGVAEAERRFERVLTCRGIEAEAALSFSGLSDLLSDVVADVAPLLLPVRRARSKSRCCSPSPATMSPMLGRSALPSSTSCASWRSVGRCWWPSTTCSGSTSRRPGRSDWRCGVCAWSASASSRRCARRRTSRCRSSSSACCPRTVCGEWRSDRWELMRFIVCCGGGWDSSWRGLRSTVSGRRAVVIRSSRSRSGASLRAPMSRWTQNGRCPFQTAWADCSGRGSSGCPGDASGPARRCSGGSADRGRGRASVWRTRAGAGGARACGSRGRGCPRGLPCAIQSSAVWLGVSRGGAGVAPPSRAPLARRGGR